MFGLGFSEILIILAIALIVLGPKNLPSAARKLGRTMAQLRRTVDEFRHELTMPPLGIDDELRRDFRRMTDLNDVDDEPEEKCCSDDDSEADDGN